MVNQKDTSELRDIKSKLESRVKEFELKVAKQIELIEEKIESSRKVLIAISPFLNYLSSQQEICTRAAIDEEYNKKPGLQIWSKGDCDAALILYLTSKGTHKFFFETYGSFGGINNSSGINFGEKGYSGRLYLADYILPTEQELTKFEREIIENLKNIGEIPIQQNSLKKAVKKRIHRELPYDFLEK